VYPDPADMLVSIYVLNTLLPDERKFEFQEMRKLAPIVLLALRTDNLNLADDQPLADVWQTSRGTFQNRYGPFQA
jgi:hypothetical protein